MALPSGTVTFLFTDIEGSTRLLQKLGPSYVDALQAHSEIIEGAVSASNGLVVNTEGDAFFCVFKEAPDAAAAAVRILTGLAGHAWPDKAEFKVRIGFHTGEGVLGAADYVGIDVHRAARISAAGHGGQALLSAETQNQIGGQLPPGVTTTDLGEHELKDLPNPEHIYQLVVPDLPSAFPALRTSAAPPLPLPPLVAPTPPRAAPATAAAAASATRNLLGSMSRAQLAAATLIAGLAIGTGVGAAVFGGTPECEVCVDPGGGAAVTTLPPGTTVAPPESTEPPVQSTTSTTAQAESGVTGTWIFTVSITGVTGSVCQDEIGEVYQRQVTITGPNGDLTVVGLDDLDDPDDPAWTGSFSNGTLVFGGTRAEDDGLTTAAFEMVLSGDGASMAGTEEWTWDWTSQGQTGTCVDGLSDVTAERGG